MAATLRIEDQVEIPMDLKGLADFRRWAVSDTFPERGRIDYLGGTIEVDMSPEDLHTHGKLKNEVHVEQQKEDDAMKRLVWLSLAVAATIVSAASAQPRAPQAGPRRFLDYLPVGSCLVLSQPRQSGDSYGVQILTAKEVEQRPEEFARLEELRKDLAELEKRQDDKDRSRRDELLTALRKSQLGRRASPVYEVIAAGEDFVMLRLKLSSTGQKAEVQSARILPAARIREIMVPIETDRPKARPQ